MTLFRGLADDLPLMNWLREHIWPAEGRWVGEEFVAAGSALAVAEMLRGGTTCFNDMYFFPQITGRVASAAGMRAVIGLIVIDFPSAWAADTDGYFSRAIETFDEFKGHPLVGTAFAPHAPYSVGDAPLARVRKLADELELPVHMHVHETRDEVDQQAQRYGRRPLARLDALGLVSPGLVAVHMTQLEDDEIALCADRGVQIVHCPESNLKLASGFCRVQRLLGAGINVALGTDGAASNTTSTCSASCARPRSWRRASRRTRAQCPRRRRCAWRRSTARGRSGSATRSAHWNRTRRPTWSRSTCRSRRPSRCTIRSRSWSTRPGGARSATCGSRAGRCCSRAV